MPTSGVYRLRQAKHQALIPAKIEKIMQEGVRGKKVKQKQAVAIAYSMARKGKLGGKKSNKAKGK